MNDNRLAAGLALLVAIPSMIWAIQDFRNGRARLIIGSRRSPRQTTKADDPGKFWRYTAINAGLIAVVLVFAVLLFFKPAE